jgi:hypothetical protein
MMDHMGFLTLWRRFLSLIVSLPDLPGFNLHCCAVLSPNVSKLMKVPKEQRTKRLLRTLKEQSSLK